MDRRRRVRAAHQQAHDFVSAVGLAAGLLAVGLAGCGSPHPDDTHGASTSGATASAEAEPRPNFVVIIADDLGYGDLSTYGGPIAAPNLDRLATEGTRFTDFHTNALCTPTRNALLTGRYPQRNGLTTALAVQSKLGLPASDITLPETLKKAGYGTGLVGKWHLGHFKDEQSPNRHGFDYFYGMRGGKADHQSHRDDLGRLDWWKNMARLNKLEYSATAVTREAMAFIDRNAAKPFYLQVAYQEPHTPYQGPNDPVGYHNVAGFPKMVRAIDEGVGKIIERLRSLGLDRRTLVVFFSDNGGHKPGSSNLPLRAGKGTVFEGGIRVPALAWWPGIVPRRVSADTVDVKDLYPTLVELASAPKPSRPLDGISAVSVLKNSGPLPPRKLFFAKGSDLAVREGRWKLARVGGQTLLFDLDRDLREATNVAANNPAKVSALEAALAHWQATTVKE